MAGMTSVVPMISMVTQGVSLFSELSNGGGATASQELALQELRAKQNTQMSITQQNAALDREKLAAATAVSEDARKDALKRAVARQRAQFGASGISSATSGSADAVLLGLFEESEEAKNDRVKLDNLRFQAIDQDISQQKSVNVLQRTQLQQRQALTNASSGYSPLDKIGAVTNFVGGLF